MAAGTQEIDAGEAQLVLHLPLESGKANDASGKKNGGTVVGAKAAGGKLGQGLQFVGRVPGQDSIGNRVHVWSHQIPILVRAMAAAGDTLFVAGPEDLLDEPAALKTFDESATRGRIADQDAALLGQSGGILRAVSCADGTTRFEQRLDTIPVWDGVAVADGFVFMAGVDGAVRCLGGRNSG